MAYFLLSANQNISESLRTKINSSIKDNGASRLKVRKMTVGVGLLTSDTYELRQWVMNS